MLNHMSRIGLALLFAFCLGSVGLTGCEEDGALENAGEKVDETLEDGQDELEDAGDELEDVADDLGDNIEDGVDNVRDEVE